MDMCSNCGEAEAIADSSLCLRCTRCVDCGTAYAVSDDLRCFGCGVAKGRAKWKRPNYVSMDPDEARDLGLEDLRDPLTRDLTDREPPQEITKEMFK